MLFSDVEKRNIGEEGERKYILSLLRLPEKDYSEHGCTVNMYYA